MEEILDFLNAYRIVIGAALTTFILIVAIAKWWDEVKLFLKSLWYSWFKTRGLAKDMAQDTSKWFRSEKVLCDDFYSDIRRILRDPDMYDRASSYLGKVQERGRSKLGIFMSIVIVGLVFVEALGFAYVLSGYTLPGASEALQVQGAFGIAFLIAAVLVWLTHQSGAEMHKRGLVAKARAWWYHDPNENRPHLIGADHRVSLEHNYIDDNSPSYIQLVNRLETNARVTPGVPVWTAVAFIAIVFVAVLATVVRYQTYQQEKIAEVTLKSGPAVSGQFTLERLPSVLGVPQAQADKKAETEKAEARDAANLTTFAILAGLFILIQVMGIGIGFKKGFAGRESATARKIVGRFNSRTEYEAWYERKRDAISRVAQKHLSTLQKRMAERARRLGIDKTDRSILENAGNRTFLVHYNRRLQEDVRRRREEEELLHNSTLRGRGPEPASAPVAAANDTLAASETPPDGDVKAPETREQMEARIRAEIEAEMRARQEPPADAETEDDVRSRLRKEMGLGT
jgi:hypothetical protein